MQWNPYEDKAACTICEDKSDEGLYRCTGKSSGSSTGSSLTISQVAVHMHMPDV